MTYSGLLIHEVTIFTPDIDSTGEDLSRYGDEELVFPGTGTPAAARVEQDSSSEDSINRDTRTQSFTVFLEVGANVNALSYLEWQGRQLHVKGEPEIVDGRSGPHHIELVCEEVTL